MDRRERFQFVGQYRCLDFVNTKFTKEGGRRVDLMRSFADLMAWLCESRLMNRKQLHRALRLWGSGHAADPIFQTALAFREALLSMPDGLHPHPPVPPP